MAFQMVAYGTLKDLIHQSINTLLKYHVVRDPKDLKDKSRRLQVYFLLHIMEILENSSDISEENKKIILNASAYFIHVKIKESYENSTFAYFQNVTNSDFFKSITTALGLRDDDNYPTEYQTFDLFQSLCNFMESQVYHEEGLEKGFKVNHPFSTIKGYNVEDDLKVLTKKLATLKCSALDEAVKPQKEKGVEKSTPKSVFHTGVPFSNHVIIEYKATNKQSVTLFSMGNKSDSDEAFEEQSPTHGI